MKPKSFFTISICIIFLFSAVACGAKDNAPKPVCPFSELTWSATFDELISCEGNNFSTYDSVYGGTCYTYSKEYDGRQGTIKYMFDSEERLMCIAWAYGCSNEDELLSLYDSISDSVNELYGESGYAADHPGNYGNVWYLETGDIVLTTMITAENKALQYAYLHPLVSNNGCQASPAHPYVNQRLHALRAALC